MSIQSQLNRLTGAKAGLKTAITEKGGSIADNALLDAYPSAVEIIPQGIDTSDANAESSDILSGKTAYVNGTKLTGTYVPSDELDTSDATATSGDILSGKTAYADGEKVSGSMPNNGGVNKYLTPSEPSYTVPKGYHNGSGNVQIAMETKTATPTKAAQDVTPSGGKVLSKVTVNPIPAEYITTSDADAAAGDILNGKTAYVNGTKLTGTYVPSDELDTSDATAASGDILSGKTAYVNGEKLSGSMPNNGNISQSITKYFAAVPPKVSIPHGYTSGGNVDLSPLLSAFTSYSGDSANDGGFAELLYNMSDTKSALISAINNLHLLANTGESIRLGTSVSIATCAQALNSARPSGTFYITGVNSSPKIMAIDTGLPSVTCISIFYTGTYSTPDGSVNASGMAFFRKGSREYSTNSSGDSVNSLPTIYVDSISGRYMTLNFELPHYSESSACSYTVYIFVA